LQKGIPMRTSMMAWKCVLAGLLLVVASQDVRAVDRVWTAGTGSYLTGTNWSGNTAPTAADRAFVDNGGTAQLTGGNGLADQLFIGSNVGTSGNYSQTGGVLNANKMTIGEGGTATGTISGGELRIGGGSLFVGGENGPGTGTLTVSNPSITIESLDDIQFGRVGTGTLNLSGGRIKGGYTVVGKFGSGFWNQTGGVFDQDFGDVEIGDGGRPDQSGEPGPRTGTINLSGGVIQTADGFAIGNRVGGGTVNISGGYLAVTGNASSTLWVGRGMNWELDPGVGAPTALRVTGNQAVIAINDAFLMNPDGVSSSSTLVANITGSAHSAIQVAGNADITKGSFKVELTGYTPLSGQSWTIIKAGADLTNARNQIDGYISSNGYEALVHADPFGGGTVVGPFLSSDLTAPLLAGLSWAVSYSSTEVTLSVTGTLKGDFDNNGSFACADVDGLVANIASGANTASFDMTGDGLVNSADLSSWLANAGAANLPSRRPYLPGDANLDGVVDGSDFGVWNSNKFTNVAAWCRGDFSANGAVDGSDFGIWNSNKFTASDSGSSSLVPEPSISLLLLGSLMLGLNRRK
jgi:hypothetical protein